MIFFNIKKKKTPSSPSYGGLLLLPSAAQHVPLTQIPQQLLLCTTVLVVLAKDTVLGWGMVCLTLIYIRVRIEPETTAIKTLYYFVTPTVSTG